ncbi:D-alanyl-D-alanine carboxypeptidase [Streptomyces sviceus]|uniref:D-alanyl-D-alanine carboxypeptidase n=1 Tax=Streptomyces sviceus TaxID=285530 RepID=UPI003820FF3D
MEEASVAGESPDRSKQRESSAEPTSGSASPVPEARSSTPDPRLAVARESISLGGIDTATRVFSVRDLPKAHESPAEAGTDGSGTGEPEDAPSATEEHPEAAEGASPTEDDSATADDPKDEGPAEGSKDSGAAEGSKGSGAAEGSDDSGAAKGSDDSGTAEGSGDSGTAETPEDAGTAEGSEDSSAAETPNDPDTTEGSDDSGTAKTPEDAGTAKTPEDDSATADDPKDEGPAEGSKGSGAAEGSGASGTAETPEDAGTAEGSEDSDTAETPDDPGTTEDSHDTDTAEGSEDSGTAETPDDPDTTDGPRSTGTAKAPSDPGTTDGPDDPDDGSRDSGSAAGVGDARLRNAVAAWVATADGDGSGKAGAAEKSEGKGAEDGSGPETDSEPETDAAGEDDDAETAVAEETPADAGESTARPAPTDPQTDDEPADTPPVDQPTAVFKAPRPAVDQPTTMLKLGKAPEAEPKPKPEPKPEPEPAPKPEADAERTSRFVALKALDEPRPKPDVTAAVPQVGPERTTQQPLPPKPPLDLLAELTNTPPPPPSPLRTLGRRVKIWTPILILLVVAFAIAQSLRPLPAPTLSLTAEDSYTFDGSKATLPWPAQGQGWMDVNGVGTMGNFGKQTPVAIGSVAKAMTAYIVLKDHPLKSGEEGAKITVDALAEKEGGYNKQGESTLNTVKAGDVLTQRQAIAAIMIPSANNIARLLARWDSGSEAAFIKKMNDTAEELGMKNTKYTDASGLKETTVSTAEDQVKLGNELVKIPALMEITSMGQWVDPSGQKWYNYNYLVPYTGIGIKTGTTSAAGGNLLFASRKKVGGETVTVVGAVLGQHKAPIIQTVNDVSKVALLAAEDALTSAKILKKGDVVGYVDDGLGGHTPVVLTKDVTAVGWAGFKVKLSFAADEVPHTAKAGTKVGTLTVGDGEGGAVKVPVTLQKDLTEPGFTDKLTRVG